MTVTDEAMEFIGIDNIRNQLGLLAIANIKELMGIPSYYEYRLGEGRVIELYSRKGDVVIAVIRTTIEMNPSIERIAV